MPSVRSWLKRRRLCRPAARSCRMAHDEHALASPHEHHPDLLAVTDAGTEPGQEPLAASAPREGATSVSPHKLWRCSLASFGNFAGCAAGWAGMTAAGDILSRSRHSRLVLLDRPPCRTLAAGEGFDQIHFGSACGEPTHSNRARMARLLREPVGDAGGATLRKQPSRLNVAPDAIAGAQRLRATMRTV